MFSLVVIAIIINFIVGFLQLMGVDAVLTVIFRGIFGQGSLAFLKQYYDSIVSLILALTPETIKSLITVIPLLNVLAQIGAATGDLRLSNGAKLCDIIDSQSCDSQTDHSHKCDIKCSKKHNSLALNETLLFILETLGITNILRVVIGTKNRKYIDVNNIIVNGILSGVDVEFSGIVSGCECPSHNHIKCDKKKPCNKCPSCSPCANLPPPIEQPSALNLLRHVVLTPIKGVYQQVYFASGLPLIPPPSAFLPVN
jgi:hypothetical protein